MAAKETRSESEDRTAPEHLRVSEDQYWGAGWVCPPRWPQDEPAQTALKHLGPLPFPRGPVPLMGILASLYEHVSAAAKDYLAGASVQPERSLK